jgi:hypothetical protein
MKPGTLVVVLVAVISAVLGAVLSGALRDSRVGKETTSAAKGAPAGEVTEVTFHMVAPDDGLATTHSGDKPLPLYPAGIGVLSDPNINQGFILLTKLRDDAGNVIGFTSEQEVVSSESDLAQGLLKTQSSWTLTIPGRGSIFLYETENQSEFLQKAGVPALAQGIEWNQDWTFTTTSGPDPGGRGYIVGGTDEFAGIRGTFAEVTHLRRFTTKGELFGTIELQLAYTKPGAPEPAHQD